MSRINDTIGRFLEAIWLSSRLGARDKVQRRADYRQRTITRAAHAAATFPEMWDGPSHLVVEVL